MTFIEHASVNYNVLNFRRGRGTVSKISNKPLNSSESISKCICFIRDLSAAFKLTIFFYKFVA